MSQSWKLIMSLLVPGAVVGWADRKVIPFAADSQSLILSSSTIFSFKIEALSRKTGQGPDSVRTGNYDMSATVVKKYKGVVMEREGQVFAASPLIYVGPIRDRPLGVWAVVSQRDLPKIGSVWVAFCAGAAGPRSAAELLKGAGASCRLAGSEAALDVELADQSEQRGELDDAINLLGQNRQKNVFYYAEYLFSRYQSVLEGNRHWPQLFSLIEDASTSPTLRSTLISDSEDVLSSGRELPLETQAGFARCLVHVVFLESDNQERENILGIDLRNWIRAVPGRELSAAEVFSDRLEEKAKLEAILATLTPSPELSAISGWLRGD